MALVEVTTAEPVKEVIAAVPVADAAAEVVVEAAEAAGESKKPGTSPFRKWMCNKGATGPKEAEQTATPECTVEDGGEAMQKVDSSTEAGSMEQSRFAKCFSMCSTRRPRKPVDMAAPVFEATESPVEPAPVIKSCLKKQKTSTPCDSSAEPEKNEDACGSSMVDETDADKQVATPSAEGTHSASDPQPTPNVEALGSATQSMAMKMSCLLKCFSMCSTGRAASKPTMVQQSTSVLRQKWLAATRDGTQDKQKMNAPSAEGTESATAPAPMPEAEVTETFTATPIESSPVKKSCFMNCVYAYFICQPITACLRRCSPFLSSCPRLACSRCRKTHTGKQDLKPASIVPVDDGSAPDIEQGTNALDFRSVHLGDEKPFVIKNVPTVSGTPVDLVPGTQPTLFRNGQFAAGCRGMVAAADATAGTSVRSKK